VASTAKQRWIIILSLLVCVVGIVNAQLMAVTERFREIGTMKCLGALDRFVLRLFY
jgi:putative ABC transport system permease protein